MRISNKSMAILLCTALLALTTSCQRYEDLSELIRQDDFNYRQAEIIIKNGFEEEGQSYGAKAFKEMANEVYSISSVNQILLVNLLIKHGFNLDDTDAYWDAIENLIFYDDFELIRYLEVFRFIGSCNETCEKFLFTSVKYDCIECVKYVLRYETRFDIENIRNFQDKSLFNVAFEKHHYEIYNYLRCYNNQIGYQ